MGLVFFYQTVICYMGCINLNCYRSKKVQKCSLMGLKVWWSWGSWSKISKLQQLDDFSFFGYKSAENFSYGFKNLEKLGVGIFFSKSPNIGRFSIFHAKLQFLRGWILFLSIKTTIIWDFLENVCQGLKRA